MQKTVGRDDVVEGLGLSLCVDAAPHVAEVAQQVKSVELQEQVAMHEAFGQPGVPVLKGDALM